MTAENLTESALALPPAERLALARRIVASLADDNGQEAAIAEGVRRIEEIIQGQTTGLTEEQFRQALR